jgi:Xaa-Pro aminopeptidase
MHLGTPTSRQRECYTRVLMGNIGLHTTIFPADTPGFMVDSFARRALWQAGLDYRHGTGHGVGAALNVHEGPQGVSPRYGNTTPLQSGMVVSNEPGYVRGWVHRPPLPYLLTAATSGRRHGQRAHHRPAPLDTLTSPQS